MPAQSPRRKATAKTSASAPAHPPKRASKAVSSNAAQKAPAKKAAPKKAAPKKTPPKRAVTGSKAQVAVKKPLFPISVFQVSPFKPDPSKYAKYQLIQYNKEVGFVFVIGTSATACTETWQLYNSRASGNGDGFARAQYIFPSYQNVVGSESTDVTTRYLYKGSFGSITLPPGITGSDYLQVIAACH